MILLIDNYDSFVHNLGRYVESLGYETKVVRNDAITVDAIAAMNPEAIILSPGPCAPQDAGICKAVIRDLGHSTPILGVCLGHQAIGEVYGGDTIQSKEPTHGKASKIQHTQQGLFTNIPPEFMAGRYHSLMTVLPEESVLTVTAKTDNGIIMAVEHSLYPVYGVQFHPESILTDHGSLILQNFLDIARAWNGINNARSYDMPLAA